MIHKALLKSEAGEAGGSEVEHLVAVDIETQNFRNSDMEVLLEAFSKYQPKSR